MNDARRKEIQQTVKDEYPLESAEWEKWYKTDVQELLDALTDAEGKIMNLETELEEAQETG